MQIFGLMWLLSNWGLNGTKIMSNSRHERFIKLAQSEAFKSRGMRRQFGAVLVDGHQIIALGYNKLSHPKIPTITSQNGERRFWGLHAEVSALLKCDFNVRGSSIYIWGQNTGTHSLVYSGPCDLCQIILKERGIKRAYYQSKKGGIICENLY